MSENRPKRERKLSLDVIRIVALCSIVMVHISAYIVINFPDPAQHVFYVGNIFNGLSRAGVPLYVMLSGALLLDETKPFDTVKFYKKSLLWMALLLIGWLAAYGVFYAALLPLLKGEAVISGAFTGFVLAFKGTDYPHLWYMFMVCGAYLLIPILRMLVKRDNRRCVMWLIIGCLVMQFAATTADIFVKADAVISVTGFMAKFHMEPLTGYVGYLLLGWYLSSFELKPWERYVLYALAIIAVAVSIPTVRLCIDTIPTVRGNFYSELSLPPVIFGSAVFVLISRICEGKATKSRFVMNLSGFSFGIYMIHVVYLELITAVFFPYSGEMSVLLYILLSYAAVMLLSWLTVLLVSKIPYVRRIFYLK